MNSGIIAGSHAFYGLNLLRERLHHVMVGPCEGVIQFALRRRICPNRIFGLCTFLLTGPITIRNDQPEITVFSSFSLIARHALLSNDLKPHLPSTMIFFAVSVHLQHHIPLHTSTGMSFLFWKQVQRYTGSHPFGF